MNESISSSEEGSASLGSTFASSAIESMPYIFSVIRASSSLCKWKQHKSLGMTLERRSYLHSCIISLLFTPMRLVTRPCSYT